MRHWSVTGHIVSGIEWHEAADTAPLSRASGASHPDTDASVRRLVVQTV